MEEKLLMLSERIDLLEKKVLNLEDAYHKTINRKRRFNFIDKEIIINILNEAISRGTIKESSEEYVLNRNIVCSIVYRKNIRRYDFNKTLKEMDFVIKKKSQDVAYKQVRIDGRTIWAYVIDKKLFKRAMEV